MWSRFLKVKNQVCNISFRSHYFFSFRDISDNHILFNTSLVQPDDVSWFGHADLRCSEVPDKIS